MSALINADLQVDSFDSEGYPTRPIIVGSDRLMALSLKAGMWFGFVVREALFEQIAPGTTARVKLAFLEPGGAQDTLPSNASILFGDGVSSRGMLRLRDSL